MRIGAVQPANPVALAPMSGITDIVFRRIAARLGAGLVISEMVASNGLAARDSESRLRAEGAGLDLHIVQLAGRDPSWMAEAARVAVGSGAAVIDINMGCPAKKVVGGYGGAALMREPELAVRLVAATVEAVPVPVTVKMRLGWEQGTLTAPELARAVEQAGARLVTVHGRTRCQFYDGCADWGAIRAVVEAVRIPVIANGDVTAPDAARAILAQSGAAGVMIGRAAQGRPWLPGAVAEFLGSGRRRPAPPLEQQLALAREHYDGLLSLMGRSVGVRHARKHLGWYLDAAGETAGRAVAADLRGRVMRDDDPDRVIMALGAAYAALSEKEAA